MSEHMSNYNIGANINKKNDTSKFKSLCDFLQQRYSFRMNTIARRVEYSKLGCCEWETFDENKFFHEVNLNLCSFPKSVIHDLVSSPIFSPPYDPIKLWFEEVSKNHADDKEDWIYQLSTYFVLRGECYSRSLNDYQISERERLVKSLKHFFTASVRCVFERDFYNKHCLIFAGAQGIGKTPFITSLIPSSLSEYVAKINFRQSSVDMNVKLCDNLIIVVDEIDEVFKKPEVRQSFKSYISTTFVKERLPYARRPSTYYRVASFLGTTNSLEFLSDPSGTDRYIIISVQNFFNRDFIEKEKSLSSYSGALDSVCCLEDFLKENLGKIWAQAVSLYRAGHFSNFSISDREENERANERYKYKSPEYEIIQDYLLPGKKDDDHSEFMRSSDIALYLNNVQQSVLVSPWKIKNPLQALGFSKENFKHRYGYFVIKR